MPIKPGTDPALGMAMLNAIIASSGTVLNFMRDKTCAPACAWDWPFPPVRQISARRVGATARVSVLRHVAAQGVKAAKVPTLVRRTMWGVGCRQGRLGPYQQVKAANPAMEGSFEVEGVKVTTAWSLFKGAHGRLHAFGMGRGHY